MKCFYHADRDAVATCKHCGKTLCRECAAKYNPCMCDECVSILAEEQQQKETAAKKDRRDKYVQALVDTRKEFLITCAIGAAVGLLLASAVGEQKGLWAVLGFFIPFGWKLLTYLQSYIPISIIGSIWFWAGWIVFKAMISILIGIPAFVYQLFRTIFHQRKISVLRKED